MAEEDVEFPISDNPIMSEEVLVADSIPTQDEVNDVLKEFNGKGDKENLDTTDDKAESDDGFSLDVVDAPVNNPVVEDNPKPQREKVKVIEEERKEEINADDEDGFDLNDNGVLSAMTEEFVKSEEVKLNDVQDKMRKMEAILKEQELETSELREKMRRYKEENEKLVSKLRSLKSVEEVVSKVTGDAISIVDASSVEVTSKVNATKEKITKLMKSAEDVKRQIVDTQQSIKNAQEYISKLEQEKKKVEDELTERIKKDNEKISNLNREKMLLEQKYDKDMKELREEMLSQARSMTQRNEVNNQAAKKFGEKAAKCISEAFPLMQYEVDKPIGYYIKFLIDMLKNAYKEIEKLREEKEEMKDHYEETFKNSVREGLLQVFSKEEVVECILRNIMGSTEWR